MDPFHTGMLTGLIFFMPCADGLSWGEFILPIVIICVNSHLQPTETPLLMFDSCIHLPIERQRGYNVHLWNNNRKFTLRLWAPRTFILLLKTCWILTIFKILKNVEGIINSSKYSFNTNSNVRTFYCEVPIS